MEFERHKRNTGAALCKTCPKSAWKQFLSLNKFCLTNSGQKATPLSMNKLGAMAGLAGDIQCLIKR